MREMEEAADRYQQDFGSTAEHEEGVVADTVDFEEIDRRSVYVGNVDYAATTEELQEHFSCCGYVSRITILTDRYTGFPKGYAYIEFGEVQYVQAALQMDASFFRGRR